MTPPTAPASDTSVKGSVVEFKDLVLAYAKQETLDPLKALVRFVGFGVAGSVLLAIGTVIGALTAVRVIQSESGAHLTGDLSWIPYLGGIAFAGLVAAVAALRIVRGR